MNRVLLAEFSRAEALIAAARGAREKDLRLLDAFTPFPIDGLVELLGTRSTRIRMVMFVGGIAVAATGYWAEWWTAAVNYPVNSGGRPFHSWPAFMLVPFATGIFAAALCGLVALFVTTGLPRLAHPWFAVEGFERASQDRFVLAIDCPDTDQQTQQARDWLQRVGAVAVREVES
jgi:hypothetical protein